MAGKNDIMGSDGSAVRARERYPEFREIVLICLIYSIERYVKPRNPTPYSDSMEPIFVSMLCLQLTPVTNPLLSVAVTRIQSR
jgi:hypothetical protein